MATVCDLYKLLSNPLRLEMLRQVHEAREGINVGILVDGLQNSGIGQSGVSQYLKQLASLGVIRRERAGRYVNYRKEQSPNGNIRKAVEIILGWERVKGGAELNAVLGALMNPFRARVVAMLAKSGPRPAMEICERTNHVSKYLRRDLQPAVDAGLIDPDDSDTAVAVYRYTATNPSVCALVSLICDHIL